MNSFYKMDELKQMKFKQLGNNVLISKMARFYNVDKIIIGSNVRIDDFCILSGLITLGNNIHISAYSALFAGDEGIVIEDFSGISSRVTIYAITDDYSGKYLSNPTVPINYRNVIGGRVKLEKHVLIGSGSIVLPNVILREGSSFGAMSLINKSSEPWTINVGIPTNKIKDRDKNLLKLEEKYLLEKTDEDD
ncbi:acyltransferase [Acholeplasma laidlawii]|uniref:acyltransferase n=1 Tax=Acholeplasma laidlawii TaxID=2148 RepID=UPI0021F6E38E|nr:hypothetical protein [Acholeplasma laidlawii]